MNRATRQRAGARVSVRPQVIGEGARSLLGAGSPSEAKRRQLVVQGEQPQEGNWGTGPSPLRQLGEAPPAFSLVELLVVIAVIGMLAALILPTLGKAKAKGQGIACLNNLRQLMVVWKLYADDNGGKLARNMAFNGIERYRADTGGWIHGWLDYSGANTDNTNVLKLIGTADSETALFGSYLNSPQVFRCPADPSAVRIDGRVYPRVRSLSMNQALGSGSTASWLPPSNYMVFQREADIVIPAPVHLLTFLDEHPDSINDAGWAFQMHDPDQRAQARLIDLPASYHNGAGSVAFADGHTEIHRWLDPRTKPPIRSTNNVSNISTPSNPDADWLAARVSSRRDGTKSWWAD